jgi:hypothetical protein
MVSLMTVSAGKIALGITDDEVPLGSHLIHFWHTDDEFKRGVRFLELGIAGESQYYVLFGHNEANQRVLEILRASGCDLARILRDGRLVILRRESSASGTLSKIDAAFSDAVDKGANAIRYLGNLGMGQAPLPGRGADEVVELESGATVLAESLSVCDRLHVRHKYSLWSSRSRRRIWNTLSYCLPWRPAAQPYNAIDNKSIAA